MTLYKVEAHPVYEGREDRKAGIQHVYSACSKTRGTGGCLMEKFRKNVQKKGSGMGNHLPQGGVWEQGLEECHVQPNPTHQPAVTLEGCFWVGPPFLPIADLPASLLEVSTVQPVCSPSLSYSSLLPGLFSHPLTLSPRKPH